MDALLYKCQFAETNEREETIKKAHVKHVFAPFFEREERKVYSKNFDILSDYFLFFFFCLPEHIVCQLQKRTHRNKEKNGTARTTFAICKQFKMGFTIGWKLFWFKHLSKYCDKRQVNKDKRAKRTMPNEMEFKCKKLLPNTNMRQCNRMSSDWLLRSIRGVKTRHKIYKKNKMKFNFDWLR